MKIIFVLDDQSVVVITPEELQLRQIGEGLAALVLPAGKNEKGEDLLRPLITYPVVLTVVPPKPVPEVIPAPPVLTAPTDISTGKKKRATKKAIIQ